MWDKMIFKYTFLFFTAVFSWPVCLQSRSIKKSSSIQNIFNGTTEIPQFVKDLEKEPDYNVNISQFVPVCSRPGRLKYCTNVNYPIPKDLAAAPQFQENMARASAELLKYLLNDTSVSYSLLKDIFCRKKFPYCNEIRGKVKWLPINRTCGRLLFNMSDISREQIRNTKICNDTKNEINIYEKVETCAAIERSSNKTYCSKQSAVSPWLRDAQREISVLLNYQYKLNRSLPKACKAALESYLCEFGLQCFLHSDIKSYLDKSFQKCEDTRKACKNATLSTGLTSIFLDCDKIKKHTEKNN